MKYQLKKISLPFEGKLFVLFPVDNMSQPFGTYDRKADAMKDVVEYDLELI